MAQKKYLSFEEMDNIVVLREKGISLEQSAVICKIGHATASRIWAVYKAAKEGNVEALKKAANSNRMLDWACERYGVTLNPKTVAPAVPAQEEKAKPDNTAQAFTVLIEEIKKLTSAVEAVDKRLGAMQLTQQGMRGELQQSIRNIIEAVHVEGDILTKEHQRQTDMLSAIKTNTKRGPTL